MRLDLLFPDERFSGELSSPHPVLAWEMWKPHECSAPLCLCTPMSSRLGLSHWDPYAMRRGGCLELYYYNMVKWSCWDSSLIWKTNWFPSVLWHCWFGHMTCCVEWDVKPLHYYYCLCLRVLDVYERVWVRWRDTYDFPLQSSRRLQYEYEQIDKF